MVALKYCCPKASDCSLFILLRDPKVHFCSVVELLYSLTAVCGPVLPPLLA